MAAPSIMPSPAFKDLLLLSLLKGWGAGGVGSSAQVSVDHRGAGVFRSFNLATVPQSRGEKKIMTWNKANAFHVKGSQKYKKVLSL